MERNTIINKGRGKSFTQACMGDVEVSSSLLSSCIYSYPYFVEEDLQSTCSLQKATKNKVSKKISEKRNEPDVIKENHYPSITSSCTTHVEHISKSKKSLTKRFQNEKPSALKPFDKRFYKSFASESCLEKVVRHKSPCTELSPVKLSHVLKFNHNKRIESKYLSNNKANTTISKIGAPLAQTKKQKTNVKNKKLEMKTKSLSPELLSIKPSNSLSVCEKPKEVIRSCSMTIAKITLNEDDRGVFVPFSWLEKFNAEEIRLQLIRKELSKIPKPFGIVGIESKFYKSRQSTLICKIARTGSIC